MCVCVCQHFILKLSICFRVCYAFLHMCACVWIGNSTSSIIKPRALRLLKAPGELGAALQSFEFVSIGCLVAVAFHVCFYWFHCRCCYFLCKFLWLFHVVSYSFYIRTLPWCSLLMLLLQIVLVCWIVGWFMWLFYLFDCRCYGCWFLSQMFHIKLLSELFSPFCLVFLSVVWIRFTQCVFFLGLGCCALCGLNLFDSCLFFGLSCLVSVVVLLRFISCCSQSKTQRPRPKPSEKAVHLFLQKYGKPAELPRNLVKSSSISLPSTSHLSIPYNLTLLNSISSESRRVIHGTSWVSSLSRLDSNIQKHPQESRAHTHHQHRMWDSFLICSLRSLPPIPLFVGPKKYVSEPRRKGCCSFVCGGCL